MRLVKLSFISFFLIVSTCYGQLLSYPPQKIMGFRGLDSRSTKPTIADSRASELQNVKLSSALDLRKRYGYSVINDTLQDRVIDKQPIEGIFDSEFSDGTSWTLAFIGDRIKYDNSGTWTHISSHYITGGKNNQVQCIMALDTAVCTNDVDVPFKIDKTPVAQALDTSDLSDSLDKAKTIVWYQNYMIFGNTVEAGIERPTRFRWSNVGTTETHSDDDFVDISTFAGDEIVGFAELYGDLYIFLTRSIWKASLVGGDDVFIFRKVIDGIGAEARDSIRVIQLSDNRTAVNFLTERKQVMLFNGVSVIDIGALIQPTLDNLNPTRLQYAASSFDGKSYYLSVSDGGQSENDLMFEFQTEIFEWTYHTDINANAMAQVKETTSVIKTYFGNYDSFIYWLDNPDNSGFDVASTFGIVEDVISADNILATGAQVIVDSDIAAGLYTGAIVKITSGTGAGEEQIVLSGLTTGVIVAQAFTTTPDTTSVYSIGAIDASYKTKPYDFGDSAKEKVPFLGMLFWAEEASNNEVTVSQAVDFGSNIKSETISLAPSGSSLWDVALWDVGFWGTTGDKIYTAKSEGNGNFVEYTFDNDDLSESFHIYGFNLLAVQGDIKQ